MLGSYFMKRQSKIFFVYVKIYPKKFTLEQKDDLSNKWLEHPHLHNFMMSASALNSTLLEYNSVQCFTRLAVIMIHQLYRI